MVWERCDRVIWKICQKTKEEMTIKVHGDSVTEKKYRKLKTDSIHVKTKKKDYSDSRPWNLPRKMAAKLNGTLKGYETSKNISGGHAGWSTMRMIDVFLVDQGFHTVGEELCVACECFSCQHQNVGGIGWNTRDIQSRQRYVHRWEPRKDTVRRSEPLQKKVLCSADS